MSRRRRPSSPSPVPVPPLEDDDLLDEILLRLPPQPPHLLRASLVSKCWRCLATDTKFLRRFRVHHGKPPLLVLFSDFDGKFSFRSALDPPCCIPPGRFSLRLDGHEAWRLLDCRHGRVLFHDRKRRRVLVWDPITDHYRGVVYPPQFLGSLAVIIDSGAVLCVAGAGDQGHLHGDCHSSPFKVVLLATLRTHQVVTVASVYFSETGMWSDFFSTSLSCLNIYRVETPGTLVGNAIHWMSLIGSGGRIQFDLDTHRLAAIEGPPDVHGSVQIIHSENGGVALASLSSLWGDPHFQMWEMKANSYGVARWVLWKSVKLQNILGLGFRISERKSSIVDYAEDIRAIFLRVHTSVYMVHLESMQSKELFKRDKLRIYHPFTSFYT